MFLEGIPKSGRNSIYGITLILLDMFHFLSYSHKAEIPCTQYALCEYDKKWNICKCTSVIPHVQLHMRQGRKVKSSTGDVYIYEFMKYSRDCIHA